MKRDSSSALETLRAEVIAILVKLEWGLRRVVKKMLEGVPAPKSGGECSTRLEEFPIDQALFHLPAVLQYLRDLPSGGQSREDDLNWAGRAVAQHLNVCLDQTATREVFPAALDAISAIIQKWNRDFPPPPDSRSRAVEFDEEWVRRLGFPMSGILLNAFLEVDRDRDEGSAFHAVLDRWCDAITDSESSATLLSLLLYVKRFPGKLDHYRNRSILDRAFDRRLCGEHWRAARHLIHERASPAVELAIHREFGGD